MSIPLELAARSPRKGPPLAPRDTARAGDAVNRA